MPEWKNFYFAQLKKTKHYLTLYDEYVLIKIIREKKIYTLHAKWIDKEFKKEQEKITAAFKEIENSKNYDRVIDSVGLEKKENFDYLD